jgi:hypothetical protein
MSKLTCCLLVGFFIRFANATYNGFFGTSFGAGGGDANFWHSLAIGYSENLVFEYMTGYIYPYILGIFYIITTDSLFLGSVFSVFGWLGSALILIRIMRLFSLDMSIQWKIMLIYSMLPSSIMYTSITMREPFQLLFTNLAFFAVLNIYCQKSKFHWLTLGFSIIGMGSLHGGLLVSGVFIFTGVSILMIYKSLNRIPLVSLLLIALLAIPFLYFSYQTIVYFVYNASSISTSAFMDSINLYQNTTISYGGRSTYATKINIDSLGALLFKMPVFLFQYLFEPMPWRISAFRDFIPLIENILRFWLIWNALNYLILIKRKKTYLTNREYFIDWKIFLFIFISYLIIETVWSVGTTNWGTSIRHHIPSMGILLVLGFSYRNFRILKNKMLNKPVTTS